MERNIFIILQEVKKPEKEKKIKNLGKKKQNKKLIKMEREKFEQELDVTDKNFLLAIRQRFE